MCAFAVAVRLSCPPPNSPTHNNKTQNTGNCLFRALSMWEHQTEGKHREMRALVVARLLEAPEAMEVTALVEGITKEEYLKRMAQDR